MVRVMEGFIGGGLWMNRGSCEFLWSWIQVIRSVMMEGSESCKRVTVSLISHA
jgi:hypothetical protein